MAPSKIIRVSCSRKYKATSAPNHGHQQSMYSIIPDMSNFYPDISFFGFGQDKYVLKNGVRARMHISWYLQYPWCMALIYQPDISVHFLNLIFKINIGLVFIVNIMLVYNRKFKSSHHCLNQVNFFNYCHGISRDDLPNMPRV